MVFVIIAVLIILNAYFSLAEIALVAVKQHQLKAEEEKKNKKAIAALRLTKDPEEFLGAVQVGITLLGILEGLYGGDLVATKLELVFYRYGFHETSAHVLSLILGIGAITYLTIVIGELLPKSIALQTPLSTALLVAPSLLFFTRVAYPFIRLLTASTRVLLRVLHIRTGQEEQITEQDLKRILSTARQQGILEEGELWLHQNIFSFSGLTAHRMMKPLSIVRTVDFTWNRSRVEEEIERYPYTFLPIYQESDDDIVGIINVKDFFLHKGENWQEVIIRETAIPGKTLAGDLFDHFKQSKLHFALVTNEQKRVEGIVTMQDVMEGIFGDIPELEDFRKYFYQISPTSWRASGYIHLQRIRRTLRLAWLRSYEEKYINLDELITGELGRRPVTNDKVFLHQYSFTVESATELHVETVRFEKKDESALK